MFPLYLCASARVLFISLGFSPEYKIHWDFVQYSSMNWRVIQKNGTKMSLCHIIIRSFLLKSFVPFEMYGDMDIERQSEIDSTHTHNGRKNPTWNQISKLYSLFQCASSVTFFKLQVTFLEHQLSDFLLWHNRTWRNIIMASSERTKKWVEE